MVPAVDQNLSNLSEQEQEALAWAAEFRAGSLTEYLDRDNWYEAAVLLSKEDFNFAVQAVDFSIWNHTAALALVAVWGAIERLFSPSNQELSFRVAANIASFLEPAGRERYACFKKVKALYDSRSKAAHGAGEADMMPYAESYAIARRVILKMTLVSKLSFHAAVPV